MIRHDFLIFFGNTLRKILQIKSKANNQNRTLGHILVTPNLAYNHDQVKFPWQICPAGLLDPLIVTYSHTTINIFRKQFCLI